MPLAQIAPPHPTPPLPIYPASVAFAPFHNLYPPTHWMSLCFDRLFVSLPYHTSTPLLSTFSLPCFYPLPPPPPLSFYPVCVSPFLFAPPPRTPPGNRTRTFRDMATYSATFELRSKPTHQFRLFGQSNGGIRNFRPGEKRRFREIRNYSYVHVVLHTF